MYFGLGNIFGAKELSTTIIPQNFKPKKEKNVLFAMNFSIKRGFNGMIVSLDHHVFS